MWILSAWLYRPLLKTLDERKSVLDGAAEDASSAGEKISALQKEYDDALQEARKDAKALFNDAHETAMAAEEEVLSGAHRRVGKIIEKGMTEVEKSVDLAREELGTYVDTLSREIGSKILGRNL
jgi:F-type H+-transporting ATPase subunit b